ncbi:somatostatin receptor type 5-like [Stylophora pistillata]|uniref:somatostatin receptor type 5-like n=1 Tax=Stylophora pistillata TaxID=50429 RepID=UPI000C04A729|nr:somatostatin receptor type 5-like [Stylophora pistillata]
MVKIRLLNFAWTDISLSKLLKLINSKCSPSNLVKLAKPVVMTIDWFWIVGWFFTFFGLVGNSWVIFIIARRRRLQTTANWFILSLAVADLGVTCGYFPAVMICNVLVVTCNNDVRRIIACFFIRASVFCLTAMVTERYIAIVHSLKYIRFFKTRNVVIIIATCWTVAIICDLIIDLSKSVLSAAEKVILGSISIMLFRVLPTMFLCAAHFHILLIARKHSLEMKVLFKQVRFNVAANSVKVKEVRNAGLKASTVRLVTVLVFIFVAYYGIANHWEICDKFSLCDVSNHEKVAVTLLILANSTLNPFVYAFFKEDIERESKAFLCRRRKLKLRPFQVHPE